jgi:hypothetical protein
MAWARQVVHRNRQTSVCGDLGMRAQALSAQSGDGVPEVLVPDVRVADVLVADVLVADNGNAYWIVPVPLPNR